MNKTDHWVELRSHNTDENLIIQTPVANTIAYLQLWTDKERTMWRHLPNAKILDAVRMGYLPNRVYPYRKKYETDEVADDTSRLVAKSCLQ